MSVSGDEGENRPEPSEPPPPSEDRTGGGEPAAPPTTTGGAGPSEDRPDPALDRDLREIASGSPERAFTLGLILGVLAAAATAIFVLQNSGSTDFEWLWFDFRLPLWLALVGAVVAGMILTLTVFALRRGRRLRAGRRRKAAGRLRQALARGGRPSTLPAASGPTQP